MNSTTQKLNFNGSERVCIETIKSSYIYSIQCFSKALRERILPPFNNLESEADKISKEEYERLCNLPSDGNSDLCDLADSANGKGQIWYSTMTGVRQSVINLYAVGLRHLFEQHLFDLLCILDVATRRKADYRKDKDILDKAIKITNFRSWTSLEELRLVCNTVKHAEGDSSKDLKIKRPDLFLNPLLSGQFDGYPDVALWWDKMSLRTVVRQPLMGENFYLQESDIKNYSIAIEDFWNELIEKLQLNMNLRISL
jgi:hypothetical protein